MKPGEAGFEFCPALGLSICARLVVGHGVASGSQQPVDALRASELVGRAMDSNLLLE